MKRINLKTITNALSSKEMKAVTGGGDDVGLKFCCPVKPKAGDECVYDQKCATDAKCVELYGSNFACTGGGL